MRTSIGCLLGRAERAARPLLLHSSSGPRASNITLRLPSIPHKTVTMPPPSTATAYVLCLCNVVDIADLIRPSLQDLQREYDKLIKERDALASSVHKLEYEVPEALGSMGWTVFSDFKTESAELVSKAVRIPSLTQSILELIPPERYHQACRSMHRDGEAEASSVSQVSR